MEAQTVLKCPECGSSRVFHDGFREAPLNAVSNEPIQRYRCAEYGHRFSKHTVLNTVQDNRETSRISASGAKNLVSAQKIKICAEKERTPTENEIKATPQIEKLLIQLENDGKAKSTVRNYRIYLKLLLSNGANLFDPENTKSVLAKMTLKNVSKRLTASLLNTWFDFNNTYWRKPKYYRDSEIPYSPTEEEIDQLIAGLGKKTATFCQIMKDTGARCGEVAQLTWASIDFKQHTVNIKAEKRSNGRILPLSDKAIEMLSNLSRKKQRLFANSSDLRAWFFTQRRRIAEKIANPNLLKIHFHTFRHWKATTELHNFHDRERVQIILGHKSSNSTETYVHIDKMLYLSKNNDAFIVKVADELEDTIKLMELGFEFHTEIAGHNVFRKRK
jgi:integrase